MENEHKKNGFMARPSLASKMVSKKGEDQQKKPTQIQMTDGVLIPNKNDNHVFNSWRITFFLAIAMLLFLTIAVPDPEELDRIWETQKYRKCSLEELVTLVIRELSKLNPQGHVHAQELYAAINLIRRCPPGPILSLLASLPSYDHLGDLHFKLTDSVPSGVR